MILALPSQAPYTCSLAPARACLLKSCKYLGAVDVDQSCIGGKEINKHEDKKLHSRWRTVGKSAVLGVKDRKTKRVWAEVIEDTTKPTMQGFMKKTRLEDAPVFTDEHLSN